MTSKRRPLAREVLIFFLGEGFFRPSSVPWEADGDKRYRRRDPPVKVGETTTVGRRDPAWVPQRRSKLIVLSSSLGCLKWDIAAEYLFKHRRYLSPHETPLDATDSTCILSEIGFYRMLDR